MNLGIWEVLNKRRCNIHYTCKNIAEYYIGDKDKPQNLHNYFLCREHLEHLYNELLKTYKPTSEAFKCALDESNTKDNINNQELKNKYLKMLYESGGMTTKAKLIDFCETNKIELPKEEIKTKDYMELIFPEINEGE